MISINSNSQISFPFVLRSRKFLKGQIFYRWLRNPACKVPAGPLSKSFLHNIRKANVDYIGGAAGNEFIAAMW